MAAMPLLCPELGFGEGECSEDWKLEEGVRGVDDWVVNLWTARGALKVRIMDASKGLAFEAVFDSDALESAGMDTRLRFEDNAHTVRSALKGEGFAKASSVQLDGSDAVLSISEEMGHRTFEYRLKLLCVPLTEIDTLRMQLAKKHSAELEKQAADFRATIEEMRQKMTKKTTDAICGSDACEQQFAKDKKLITELSEKIASLEAAKVKTRSDGTLDFDSALEHLKAAMATVSHSTAKVMEACRSLELQLLKEKAHVASEHRTPEYRTPEYRAISEHRTVSEHRTAEHRSPEYRAVSEHRTPEYRTPEYRTPKYRAVSEQRSPEYHTAEYRSISEHRTAEHRSPEYRTTEHRTADDLQLRPKIMPGFGTRGDAPIRKVVDYYFDAYTKSGKETCHVSMDGKSAVANVCTAQFLVKPKVCVDAEIAFVLESFRSFIAVGVKDSGKGLSFGCRFDSRGTVTVSNAVVAPYQAFGGWHRGDRLVLTANVSNGTISIRTPTGVFSTKWMPYYRCSTFWFVVECGSVGDKVRID